LAIIVVVFSSTINAVEADIVAGDEFELFFPITNDNNYLATYEFYLVVNPDAEGFNITISPMSLELNPDETVNVTILVTTPLHAAGGFYEFILYYNYSGQESGGENQAMEVEVVTIIIGILPNPHTFHRKKRILRQKFPMMFQM